MSYLDGFPQSDRGFWLVNEPVDGSRPQELTMTQGAATIRFSEFVGVHRESTTLPDVLAYESCEVVDE